MTDKTSRWDHCRALLVLLSEPVRRWSSDRCSSLSASIAFYAAFSLAPTLVIVVGVASFFYGADAAQGHLFAQLSGVVGNQAASSIQALVANAWQTRMGPNTTLISIGIVVVGASATFSTLSAALNEIWPVPPTSTRASLIGLVRVRLLSFGLVIGVGFLVVVLLILDAVIAFIGTWIWGESSPSFLLANAAQHLTTVIVLWLAFAVLLKFLPDAYMRWRDALLGGVAAALLFTGGKHLFALYLAHAGMANTFGAAGSLAVVLMWLYYSAAVFLLGAEVAAASGRHRVQAAAGWR